MREHDAKGNFLNNKDIYDLEVPACRSAIAEYVSLNPCDTPRATQFANLENVDHRRRMGFFMYAICESCCDCIPIGSREGEYDDRKAGVDGKKLIQVRRGNCAAHMFYDVCAVWPRIKSVSAPGGKVESWRHQVCPLVRKWEASDASADWMTTALLKGVDKRILRFLHHFNVHGKCRSKKVWNECVKLEFAQGRV